MSNKLTQWAHDFLSIEADLPFRFKYDTEKRRNNPAKIDDFDMKCYEYELVDDKNDAGRVVILIPVGNDQPYFVYFDGKYAYSVEENDDIVKFLTDVSAETVVRGESVGVSPYQKD